MNVQRITADQARFMAEGQTQFFNDLDEKICKAVAEGREEVYVNLCDKDRNGYSAFGNTYYNNLAFIVASLKSRGFKVEQTCQSGFIIKW